MYGRMNSLYIEAQEVSRGYQVVTVRARADPRDGQYGASGEVVVLEGALQGQRLELRYGRDIAPLELGQTAEVRGIVQGLPLEARQQHRFSRGLTGTLSVQSIDSVYYANSPLGQLWSLRASLQKKLKTQAAVTAEDDKQIDNRTGQSNYDPQSLDATKEKSEAYGLIAGLTYGDRRELKDSPLESALQRTGLAHFLAVSGTHMALLGALLFFALNKTSLGRIGVSAITLLICTCFVFFTGFAAGSIRSVLMLAFALGAYCLWRRVCVLSSMGLAGLIMLILDPLLAISLGFLLSFGSVAGIVIFGRYIQQWLTCLIPVKLRQRSKTLTNGLAIALVAALVTLPLTLEAFGILPLIGPLANLLLAPALCALLILSFVAHFFLLALPPLGMVLLDACLIYSGFLGTIIKRLAQISWASIPMEGLSTTGVAIFIGGLVALWIWWPKPNRRMLLRAIVVICCVLIVAGSYTHFTAGIKHADTSKTITVLDVGQGDAMLVRDGGHTVLVDAGPSPALLREQLNVHQVKRIDTLIFTHGHADHVRGAQMLDASYGVREIVVAEGGEDFPAYLEIAQRVNAPIVTALAGDIISMDALDIRFIWPPSPVSDPSANGTSLSKLIVDTAPDHLDENELDIVFNSGDAEAPDVKKAFMLPEIETALQVNGKVQSIDVMVVPHHGSKASLDKSFLEKVAPNKEKSIAIISAGKDNQFGHPRPEPLELIGEYFLKLYRTDKDGSVTIEL